MLSFDGPIINLHMLVKSWYLVHALHGPKVSSIVLAPLYVVCLLHLKIVTVNTSHASTIFNLGSWGCMGVKLVSYPDNQRGIGDSGDTTFLYLSKYFMG